MDKALWKQRIAVLVLMVVATGLFYWQIWTPSDEERKYFEGDIFDKDYPARASWVRTVREYGRFPFWNSFEFGGWPALANCEAGVLYPPNWLLLAAYRDGFLTYHAVQGLVLVHFVFAGWFMFLLLRQYRLSILPSIAGSLVYMLCAFHGGHKLHINMFCAIIWFPLILFFVEKALEQKHWTPLLFGSLFLAISYLAGHPQMAFYISFVLALRILWQWPSERYRLNDWRYPSRLALLRLVVLFIPAIALASVQIVPALQLFGFGARAEGSYAFATEFSLPPRELVEFFLPTVFPWYYVEVLYVGLWAWLFAWIALRSRQGISCANYWSMLLVLGVLMGLGEFSGLFHAAYRLLPVMGRLRAPSRWLYFSQVALAVLAAVGLEKLIDLRPAGRKRLALLKRALRWILAGLAVFLAYVYAQTLMPHPSVHLDNFQRLASALFMAVVILGAGWVLITVYRKREITPTLFAAGFCLLIYIDLATFNNDINVVDDKKAYEMNPVVETLRNAEDGLFRYLQPDGNRQLANGNVFGLQEASGHSPLVPTEYLRFLSLARENVNLLQMMGVRFFCTEVPPGATGSVEQVRQDLWRLPGAFPRAFHVQDVVPVGSTEVQEALLRSEVWDYAQAAWTLEKTGAINFKSAPVGGLNDPFPKPVLIYSASEKAKKPGAYLVLNGVQVCPSRRGYHLAVIDPYRGEVQKTALFDTAAGPGASEALSRFVEQIEPGMYTIGAIGGEAASQLSLDAENSLKTLGLSGGIAGNPGKAHAFVGIKGSETGQALEISADREAIVALGITGGKFITMSSEGQRTQVAETPVEHWSPGKMVLRPKQFGFTVVTEYDYPGWRLRGERKLRVNGIYQSIYVDSPGEEVNLFFLPSWWYLWAFISLISLFALIAAIVMTMRVDRRRTQFRARKPLETA